MAGTINDMAKKTERLSVLPVVVLVVSLIVSISGYAAKGVFGPNEDLLSPERAPRVQGALFHGAQTDEDGTPVFKFRAWQPEVQVTFSNSDRCRLEIENINADQALIEYEGKKEGLIDLALTGIDLQKPRSTVISASIPRGLEGSLWIKPPAGWGRAGLFAIIGDTQGNSEAFQTAIKQINLIKPDFVVHLGDLTPDGREEQIREFLEISGQLFCPLYSVPGNHDAKGGRIGIYQKWLQPSPNYAFTWGGSRLLFLDNASGSLTDDQFSWLREEISQSLKSAPEEKIQIFMHMPADDPRGGAEDHAMTDRVAAGNFLALTKLFGKKIAAVYNGHVHMYDRYEKNGVQFITSGGGGAGLYAEAEDGGYNHWLLVKDTGGQGSLDIAVQRFEPPARRDIVTVVGPKGQIVLDSGELQELYNAYKMDGNASFENQYGNINGKGEYAGIPIRSLLKQVGGMTENNRLLIQSVDGYQQSFSYQNVYPESAGWQETQGEMILALSCNGEKLPQWKDGYRIVFLTADGLYSNKDCELTSAPGEGWNEYQSAGARWIRYVVKLEVK